MNLWVGRSLRSCFINDDTDGKTTAVGSTTLREQNTLVATVRFVLINCG